MRIRLFLFGLIRKKTKSMKNLTSGGGRHARSRISDYDSEQVLAKMSQDEFNNFISLFLLFHSIFFFCLF